MNRIVTLILALWANEPARVVSWIVAGIAAVLGVTVADADVLAILTVVIPVLVGGEATRQKVSPYVGDFSVASDDLLTEPNPARKVNG